MEVVPEPDKGHDWKDLAKIVAAAAALPTALGGLAVTGVLGRTQRNHPLMFVIALGCVIVASALWVLAAVRAKAPDQQHYKLTSRRLEAWGVGLFAFGVVLGFLAVVVTQSDVEKPSIDASFDPETLKLTATVNVANLGSRDQVSVSVDGLDAIEAGQGEQYHSTELYKAFLGPNAEGVVSAPIELRIPPGVYDHVGIRAWTNKDAHSCTDYVTDRPPPSEQDGSTAEAGDPSEVQAPRQGRAAGCVIFLLPRVPQRPSLSLSWNREDRVMSVNLSSDNSAAAAAIRVTGIMGATKSRVLLGRFVAEPGQDGKVSAVPTVHPPPGVTVVCAEARFLYAAPAASRPGCPLGNPRSFPQSATAQMTVGS